MSRPYAFCFCLLVSWLALDLFALAYGHAPFEVVAAFAQGTWGTTYGIGQILFKATPLLLTGLAVRVALRAGLFNVGAEGQLAVASIAVGAVGVVLPQNPFSWILLVVVAALSGALFAAVPAILSRRAGGGLSLLATILMNRLADPLVALLLHAGLAETDSSHTRPMRATLPRLDVIIPSLHGSAVSVALPFAIAVAFAVDAFLRRSRIAREWMFVRENRVASAKVGISVDRRLAQAMLVSGALAGLVGLATVAGYKGYYEQGLGAGAGFAGIGVALLGGESAVGLIVAALLFGTLSQGGLAINALLPREILQLFEAGIIVFVALLTGESWSIIGKIRWRKS